LPDGANQNATLHLQSSTSSPSLSSVFRFQSPPPPPPPCIPPAPSEADSEEYVPYIADEVEEDVVVVDGWNEDEAEAEAGESFSPLENDLGVSPRKVAVVVDVDVNEEESAELCSPLENECPEILARTVDRHARPVEGDAPSASRQGLAVATQDARPSISSPDDEMEALRQRAAAAVVDAWN
jgi:hypothetical protein